MEHKLTDAMMDAEVERLCCRQESPQGFINQEAVAEYMVQGHAEAEDELKEGSSGACNTSAVQQGPAGASQGSAESLPSDVSGCGSGVEAAPSNITMSRSSICVHCDVSTEIRDFIEGLYSSVRKDCINGEIEKKPGKGQLLMCELCDCSTALMSKVKLHRATNVVIVVCTLCEWCYDSAHLTNLKRHIASKHCVGQLFA